MSEAEHLENIHTVTLISLLNARGLEVAVSDDDDFEWETDELFLESNPHIAAAQSAFLRRDDREGLHQLYLALGRNFSRLEQLADMMK